MPWGCFKQYLCLLVSLSINYLKGQIPVRLLSLLFNSVLWLFVLFVLQCQRVMCKTACAVWVLVDLFSADNSMCGQAAFLFQSAVESRDWNYVSIHGFCGQLLLWAIRFFLQSDSMWKTPLMKKDILRIRGENDTGTQCAQTCFLICTRTLRASLLWSTSLRHPHRGIHPQASITRFLLWQTFLLLISVLFVKVSADQQDE